jgi:single-stranded-DNA-specific exonuclease
MLMKDMDRAVARIRSAVAAHEKIAVFGDYDVDGITSTCILVDYLTGIGADCIKYIPDRVEDGYGLSVEPLKRLAAAGAKLIVTVDCGITAVEETKYARALGLDVVITDHHECRDPLPEASAVVDPHRSDCRYPFKHLAGVGVALKLVMALGGEENERALFRRYCPLAAIGTVADVMCMTGENRTIVTCGLAHVSDTDFVGLRALLRETKLSEKTISSVNIGFVLSPRINAAGRLGRSDGGGADVAADLLLTRDPARAEELAKTLCGLNCRRQEIEQGIVAEAEDRICSMPENERNALVLESEDWNPGVVGIVASRLAETNSCPAFVIHLKGDMGKGSCRSFGGFNLFAALGECGDLLEDFGGHELAAGFTIKRENIPALRTRLNECAGRFFGSGLPVSALDIDAEIDRPEKIDLAEIENLSMLEPYGSGNLRPVFCVKDVRLDAIQNVGQNRHMKVRLEKNGASIDGIFFSTTTADCDACRGDNVDAAFYLTVNEFRDKRSPQLQLVALRNSDSALHARFSSGDGVSAGEAARLLPARAQCEALWKYIFPKMQDGPLPLRGQALFRSAAQSMGGESAFLRAMVITDMFVESGLVEYVSADGETALSLLPKKRVALGDTGTAKRLASALSLQTTGL